jgi:hypothetical protein
MISNHALFIGAIRDKNLVRIVFYSHLDAGKVDHECAPLDYGPALKEKDTLDRYWVWDNDNTAGANPLGLFPDQIVSVQVTGRNFAPEHLALGPRVWSVIRDWAIACKGDLSTENNLNRQKLR